MSEKSITVADLLSLAGGDTLVNMSEIVSDESMADFCENEVHHAIKLIEENPQYHQDLSEDQITNLIIMCLRSKGLQADHDVKNGGHVDILMRVARRSWKAEAKLFETKSFTGLLKGMLQLTSRYMSTRDKFGALLIYTYQSNVIHIMDSWRSRIGESTRVSSLSPCSFCDLSFFTTYRHPRSGLNARIRHTVACLHYRPED